MENKKIITLEEILMKQLNNELNEKHNWYELCINYQLTEEALEQYHNKLDWDYISKY